MCLTRKKASLKRDCGKGRCFLPFSALQVEKIQKAIRSIKELNQLKDITELKVRSLLPL